MKQYFDNQLNKIVEADIQKLPYIGNASIECLKYYPEHLYKYRDCKKEHNFEMLEKEYLWADIPAKFFDPFDSLINHKLKSELPDIQRWIYQRLGEITYYFIPPQGMQPYKNGQSLENYKKAQKRFIDSAGRYNAQMAKKIMFTEIKKLSSVNQRNIQKLFEQYESASFRNKLQNAIQEIFLKTVNTLREKNLVYCLTQRRDNQKMWEEYANKYSGFVIEYDLSLAAEHHDTALVLARTFPVTYYKRLPKVPLLPFIECAFNEKLYNKATEIFDATKKLYKQLIIKKDEYCGEEEWRILSTTQRIEFPVVSAVYMGYKIAGEHEVRLKKICAKKNIPLYKQEFNPFIGTMCFELVKEEGEKI